MLVQLHIRNFAIIDEVNIEFSNGLNILTGETGAGKSIVIDAVGLLLGGRAQTDFIRAGCDKAIVEGVFEYFEPCVLAEKLKELGLADEGQQLVMTREISLNNKNYCRINSRIVTLGVYKEIGKLLIDIHGQHDHQSLLNSDSHGDVLDRFGDQSFQTELMQVKETYSNMKKVDKQLKELLQSEQQKKHRMDLLNFQVKEIEDAELKDNEDIELEKEFLRLSNGEKIVKATNNSYQVLFSQHGRQMSIYDQLNQVLMELLPIQNIDEELNMIYNQLEGALYQIEENAKQLRDFGENFEFSNDRLDYVIERLQNIKDLKKKYGTTIEEITKYLVNAKEEFRQIEDIDLYMRKFEKELNDIKLQYVKKAEQISIIRKKIAKAIERKIGDELKELAMSNTVFQVSFTNKLEESNTGLDEIEFLISPNPGEPLKPLSKIASGGEMSRIMLALKIILSEVDSIETLIFDEIDSGVGGRAVQMVAEKLYLLSKNKQVICVTHSPHIASFADTHYQITKNLINNRTVTNIIKLDEEARIYEIARMLGDTDGAKQHALELLKAKTSVS